MSYHFHITFLHIESHWYLSNPFQHSNWTGSTSFDFKHPLVRHPLWRLDHHWHRSQYLPGRFPGDSSDCAMPWPASQRHDRVERYVVRCHQNLGEKIPWRSIQGRLGKWSSGKERKQKKKGAIHWNSLPTTFFPYPTPTYCKFGIGTFVCVVLQGRLVSEQIVRSSQIRWSLDYTCQ